MPLWFFKSQKYIFKNRFKLLKNAMDKKDNNSIPMFYSYNSINQK